MAIPTSRFGQFKAWLYARAQQRRDDAIGDFARDYRVARCCHPFRTISGLDRHMKEEHGAACDGAYEARDRAWREFASANP